MMNEDKSNSFLISSTFIFKRLSLTAYAIIMTLKNIGELDHIHTLIFDKVIGDLIHFKFFNEEEMYRAIKEINNKNLIAHNIYGGIQVKQTLFDDEIYKKYVIPIFKSEEEKECIDWVYKIITKSYMYYYNIIDIYPFSQEDIKFAISLKKNYNNLNETMKRCLNVISYHLNRIMTALSKEFHYNNLKEQSIINFDNDDNLLNIKS